MSQAPKILIVADEPRMGDRLRGLLTDRPCEVHVVHDEKGAAGRLSRQAFDLVLLDVLTHGLNVEDLMEHIERETPGTSVILITGHASLESDIGSMRDRIYDYLTKPLHDEELIKRVLNALDMRRLEDDRSQGHLALKLEREQLVSIFDSIDHPVYVSDVETYDVLYANGTLRKKFGSVIGKKCYKVFQGEDSPCPFCTSEFILEKNAGMPHVWEFQNRMNKHWYHCIDGVVRWFDGRMARYQMAIDITKRKETEEALRASEARYRNLVQNANSIIFRRNLEGRITFANEFAQTFFGYTADEIIGKNVIGTIVPERDSAGRDLAAMIRAIGRHPERFASNENENIRKNGERAWIAWTNKAIRDKDGNVVEILCVGNDITERRKAEQALRESEERFREMAALLPTMICEMDTDLHITYANNIGLETFGFSQDDLEAGINAVDMIHPDDREKAVDRLERIAGGENLTASEYRLFKKDQSQIIALVNSAPIYRNGDVIGLRTSVTDITEQKKLERQLQQAQKMEAIGTLAGGIAHDFNNLLMGIQGSVSIMLTEMDPTHPHFDRLNSMEKRIQSGANLTSHLLGYARKGKYEVRSLDLNELVEETCETFGRTRKDITLVKHLADDLLPIEADAGQIEQVLMNLYVNAADAMPSGGNLILESMNTSHEAMRSDLYTPLPGDYVMLTVTDTGTGMDRKTRERIFDPFFTTKEMGRGTGLGLASVYGIIKGHGGYIYVESEVGHGSAFRVFLPISEKPVHESVEPDQSPKMGRETVLLVDDEEDIREVGRELLEIMGYRVLTAQDGKKAVELYRHDPQDIDVILLDIVMPIMGGGKAFDRIKEINPDVKVLLCSGFSIEGEASEILARGGNGFIQKPFSMNQLSDKLRQILDQV